MWKELFSKTDAVLFDLDGTVVDSMWIWKQIDIDYFARFGIVMPENYQRLIEGLSFYETAVYTHDHFIPQVSVEDMINDWNAMAYSHYVNKVKPKPYIDRFLSYLADSGIKLGIATSNSKILCNATLEKNGLIKYFDSILTGEECGAGKPAPDVYINSAKALGVKCENCIVFEDICKGLEAGKAAGMVTVAVHDEYSSGQWKEKCDLADHYIMSYKEITDEIC